MRPAAPLDEVLEFCNIVRQAGGGKPLNALLPGIPSDSESCLIAKNLNFECNVSGVSTYELDPEGKGYGEAARAIRDQGGDSLDEPWGMFVKNFTTVEKIGKAANLKYAETDNGRGGVIILPRRIGNVAANFDVIASNYRKSVMNLIEEGVSREDAFRISRAKLTRAMKHYLPMAEINEDELARDAESNYKEGKIAV